MKKKTTMKKKTKATKKTTGRKRGQEYVVGVDVGGSKVMIGVFTSDYKLVKSAMISTEVFRGADSTLERIAESVRDLVASCGLELKDILALGIGTPGIIDIKTGNVVTAPNLRWENFALRSRLSRALRVPVYIGNDCTVAMEGVYDVELKRKPRNAFGIFMGTGLGGALVLDGRVYAGTASIAGEVGHMVVERYGPPCGCGSQGCFEAFASRTGIADRMRAEIATGGKTELEPILDEDRRQPGTLRNEHLRDAMRRGDPMANRVVKQAAEYTGLAVASLINLLSPEVVVLGGGLISTLHAEIMPIVDEKVRAHALLRFLRKPIVFATRLGDRAGIIGAAVMARNKSAAGE